MRLAVVGVHLSGQPLNGELTERGARMLRTTRTAAGYRLYVLKGTVPPRPALAWVPGFDGPGIEVEEWMIPETAFGGLVAAVPPPLAIGTVALEDDFLVKGFLCEPHAVVSADDITAHRGWRAYLAGQSESESPGNPSE